MHLMLGSLSLVICFFTIASNAISGVKRPTLIPVIIIVTQGLVTNILSVFLCLFLCVLDLGEGKQKRIAKFV